MNQSDDDLMVPDVRAAEIAGISSQRLRLGKRNDALTGFQRNDVLAALR